MSDPSSNRERILADLLKEKDLWAIYRRSRQIPFSKRNLWVGLIAAAVAFAWSLNAKSAGDVVDQLQSLATLAFNTSIGLLGFLLAGFSFFATVFDKKMFCRMAEYTHAESGLSYLKYNFFSFMRMFCEYFVLAMVSLLFAEVFATNSGARTWLSAIIAPLHWPQNVAFSFTPKHAAASALYGVFLGSTAYLLMQLNSFIFNIYHVSMSSVRWALEEEYEHADQQHGKQNSSGSEMPPAG